MTSGQPAFPIASGQPGTNVGGNAQQAAVPGSEEAWDEAKLEQAMKTLKEMHIQCRNLRSTIPRLLAPLATKQQSPEQLYSSFQQAVTTSNQEVRDFTRLMKGQEGVELFEHAKRSRAENPHGIKPWRVTQHPGWLDRNT
ncbi:hypothetical protein DSL72_006971 [Monilinia vaccinii-corymbosi]|uniref:Uncharacterized protein n=1 Tax=Monilinia vaccinii-corymbosi TaxID=61207 RepID=A0A8A3PLK2_9HELO|nr:hypothetical protein DSL72_006971 [Monilinia vaccinii-corymbosi]